MEPGALFPTGRRAHGARVDRKKYRAVFLRSVFVLLIVLTSACNPVQPTFLPIYPTDSPVPTRTPFQAVIPETGSAETPLAVPTRYNPLIDSLLNLKNQPAATSVPPGAKDVKPTPKKPAAGATPNANPPAPKKAPAPADTATALPTGRLAGGTLGLIPSAQGLWAIRPDGSQVTLISSDPITRMRVSPGGTMAAYITNPDPNNPTYEKPYGYQLKIISLNNNQITTITSLSPPGLSAKSSQAELDSVFQTLHSYDNGGMAWAPDGRTLAFVSSHEGPNGDVYLYSPSTGSLRALTHFQLPEGPAHAFQLSWSPNGVRLFYSAAYSFGSGAGTWLAGAWVSSVDGAQTQVAPGSQTAGENLVSWLPRPNIGLIISSYNPDCGDQNLRMVNLRTNQATTLWPNCYADRAFSRGQTEVLISVTGDMPAPQGENPPGLYRVSIYRPQPVKISDKGFEKLYSGDASGFWYGYNPGEGISAISYGGQITPAFTGPPFDGPSNATARLSTRLDNGAWLFNNGPDGLLIAWPNTPPEPVINIPVEDLTASPTFPGLYFFTSPLPNGGGKMGLFAFSTRDWKPYQVDPRIEDPQGIEWNH